LKFGQLILSKIIKIVATSCQISRLKCTEFDFGWGSAPDLAGGAYSAPPDPLAQWFPTGGKFPLGEILVFQGGNSGRAGNINIEVKIALINIHVCLIFLNNSWNHPTNKSKSQFFASYIYLSTKYRIILMK